MLAHIVSEFDTQRTANICNSNVDIIAVLKKCKENFHLKKVNFSPRIEFLF